MKRISNWSPWKSAVSLPIFLSLLLSPLWAEQVVLAPVKDITIYEHQEGALSNAKGEAIFAGINGDAGGNRVMRALLAFDLGSVPPGSTVESATLTMLQANPRDKGDTPREVSLHKLLQDWGEGTSIAEGGGGGGAAGAPATHGDATWFHRFFDSNFWLEWDSLGGDFEKSSSSNAQVS